MTEDLANASRGENFSLSPAQTDALVRLIETAPRIVRRSHFYTWAQCWVGALLPHDLLMCGAFNRKRREVGYELFNSIVMPPALLASLSRSDSPVIALLVDRWIDQGGEPLVLSVESLMVGGASEVFAMLLATGVRTIAAHGVARPQRVNEIESFFVFGCRLGPAEHDYCDHLELLLPNLHSVWQRVAAREQAALEGNALTPSGHRIRPSSVSGQEGTVSLTARELEILHSVRLGYRNHEIGSRLGISPLTVKNHLQKILKKLGAANRAQAVAEAIDLGVLDRSESRRPEPPSPAP